MTVIWSMQGQLWHSKLGSSFLEEARTAPHIWGSQGKHKPAYPHVQVFWSPCSQHDHSTPQGLILQPGGWRSHTLPLQTSSSPALTRRPAQMGQGRLGPGVRLLWVNPTAWPKDRHWPGPSCHGHSRFSVPLPAKQKDSIVELLWKILQTNCAAHPLGDSHFTL